MSITVRAALRGLVCLLVALGVGCDEGAKAPAPLVLEGPIVAVPRELSPDSVQRLREGLGGATSALQADSPETFYLALKKSELGQRWFMSAFLKQNFPEAVGGNGGVSLGVRVVAFQQQNGKLYAFDVDDTKVRSTLYDPQELVEAWPIVTDHPVFNRLPGASEYILFDPAAGLDRVMAVDELRSIMYGPSFEVELSFAQRFRALADGVSFEKVFTGHGMIFDSVSFWPEPDTLRATATVGIALRRYRESPGYTPTPLPAKEHYFSGARLKVPDSGGLTQQVAQKWHVHPGMQPITWVLSETVAQAQQHPRYQGYDLVGAMKRGVENWNAAFGFPVFTTRLATPDESIADDDKNFLLLDPDPSYGYGLASTRTNPNNGEVLGANVYLSIAWFNRAIDVITGAAATARAEEGAEPSPSIQLIWNDMVPERLCELSLEDAEALLTGPQGLAAPQTQLTQKERVERFFTYIVMHEVGHTLGLRHNFKGSFGTPLSSVMEYAYAPEQELRGGEVGPYDVAAIRFLYGLSSTLPQEPFCTDSDSFRDPDCNRFDATANPLELFYGAAYREQLRAALEQGAAAPQDAALNGVLQYVRAGRTSAERLRAWDLAMEGIRAPIAPEVLAAFPGYGAAADAAFQRAIRRLFLDSASLRGSIRGEVRPDAQLTPLILAQLRAGLLNVDGVRGYPTRRMVVDVLKKLQTYEAYAILREARLDLEARLPGLSGQELLAAEDLHSRIQRATSPYFP